MHAGMDDTAAREGCYPTLILTAIYGRFQRGIHLPAYNVDAHACTFNTKLQ
jgi:hypothetical protein